MKSFLEAASDLTLGGHLIAPPGRLVVLGSAMGGF
jgi:hypothetical protein